MTRNSVGFVLFLILLTGAGLWWYYDNKSGTTSGLDLGNPEFIALGKTIYARECAICHGKNREGQTPNWRTPLPDGSFPAPPHNASGHTWHHPDSMLFEITKYGRLKAAPKAARSTMPAFAVKLSDREIWAVLAYIKSQWPAEVRQRHHSINQRHRARH